MTEPALRPVAPPAPAPSKAAAAAPRAVPAGSISALMPVYNEEVNLEAALAGAAEALGRHATDWEVVVVESGSTDRSLEVVRAAARREPRIRWLHQPRREGVGAALRAGYPLCRMEWVAHLEADLPFDLDYLGRAAEHFEGYDFIGGYRASGEDNEIMWRYARDDYLHTVFRGTYHYGYRLFLTLLYGVYVNDVNFSFKLIRRSLLERLALRSKGWFIDTELVFELVRAGARIKTMPVEYRERRAGRSTVRLWAPLPMIRDAVVYRLTRWRGLGEKVGAR
jgi:glycosyltransferase involved in cell wall biosynthesis